MRRCSRLLYRAAVFFLMIPDCAEVSITEKVCGMRALAAAPSFATMAFRIARI